VALRTERPLPEPPHMQERDLIHDWNAVSGGFDWSACRVELNDETLRDGLQSPSVTDPDIEEKKRLVHLMAELGIAAADIGLPGAGPRAFSDTLDLAQEIAESKIPIAPNCAARTIKADVEPVIRISQAAGIAIECATFIGSSPIRQYAEDWAIDDLLRMSEAAVTYAAREGLPVMFVTEDTTRAQPETLRILYGNAIRWGARRLCLADTVGHGTPEGTRALVRFVKEEIIAPSGEPVLLDWHGHRDRGFGLANCFAAIEAGVDRVHATALGIGERVGNVEMDLLLINLKLLGAHTRDLHQLPAYAQLASRALGVPIPPGYPALGEDAFRTGTGVHAAAIIKARQKGHAWLADRIYSGVPAGELGLEQRIDVSHVSGLSNVKWWLAAHGYDAEDTALCQRLFDAAKTTKRALRDDELTALVSEHRSQAVRA
jgi:isopropylmalate/homocitrate/citramalate synthase